MTTRRIDKALEHFRAGERDLYTEEGQRLYSDEEHECRHDALLAEFDREKDSAVAEADRTIEKAERTLALEHRDLSDSLTNTELERANAKRSYVEDDVWSLPPETLLKRARAAQVAADRPTMFLYARTLQKRAGTEYEAANTDEAAKGAAAWRGSPRSLPKPSEGKRPSATWRKPGKRSGTPTASRYTPINNEERRTGARLWYMRAPALISHKASNLSVLEWGWEWANRKAPGSLAIPAIAPSTCISIQPRYMLCCLRAYRGATRPLAPVLTH